MRRMLRLWVALLAAAWLVPSAAATEPPGQACRLACQARPSPDQRQCLAQCAASQPSLRDAPSPAGASPSAETPGSFGAVYLGTPPNMSYGMSIGQRNRLDAHRVAEVACRASGAICTMAEELREPCAAVAEGVRRAQGALFMTSDPRTYVVRAVTIRSAGNRADAERDALDVCRQRERGALTCRIVQAECAPR